MISVIGVGDNTVDRYLHLGQMFPGGNAVNVAVHARRLGCRSAYLGWIAKDARGGLVSNALREEGIDLSHSRMVEGENAFCDISLVDGDRVFGDYSEGVCGQIRLDENDLAFIAEFDLVHTSVYSHLDSQLDVLADSAGCFSYDFSQEWDMNFLEKALPYINIAIISNPEESIILYKDLMEFVRSRGSAKILMTNGEKGAVFFDGFSSFYQPVMKTANVVDTLGAGDAFAARFMIDYLRNIPIQKALDNAARYAVDACAYHGAFGHGIPIK